MTIALQELVGIVGIGVAILLFVVLGNPSAGGAYQNALLPGFWRAIGNAIPNGAGVDALRRIVYFHGDGVTMHLVVIGLYCLVPIPVAFAVTACGRGARPRRPEHLRQASRAQRQAVGWGDQPGNLRSNGRLQMNRTHLSTLEVSAQGLGCMGMSEYYGHADWDTSIQTIHRALELGVTFIDTADVYGAGHNEVLVGRALHDRRGQVQLATKFGIDRTSGDMARTIRGDAAYVKRSCDTSLLRLGVDVIDLYYIHRPPQNVEVEETIGAMAELVTAGKVRYSESRSSTVSSCAGRTPCTRSPRCRASTRSGPARSRRQRR